MTPARFKKLVWSHYHEHGRALPWRETKDPYRIFVSEVMLQQTQVPRVIPKYHAFIEKFSGFKALAKAPLRSVLKAWMGLGYNSRALRLKRSAEIIMKSYEGKLPKDPTVLEKLPGIGRNTAGSIAAFAFNSPAAFVETNIRAVFIHEFFPNKNKVSDADLFPLIEKTLDRKNPREWYYALMDYGVFLKRSFKNPAKRSAHHARQSPFKGSRRELRAKLLRAALEHPRSSAQTIVRAAGAAPALGRELLDELVRDGLVGKRREKYYVE